MRLRYLYNLCRNLIYKGRVAQDLDHEIRSYIELLTEDKVRSGMERNEALRQAKRELGDVEHLKEAVRDVKTGASMDNLLQDLRYGLRVLRKNPGFATTAILTLALGIGATTAIFSIVDAVMFKPLPFPTAGGLVRIESAIAATGKGDVASYPDFLDWRKRNDVCTGMAVFRTNDFTLIAKSEPMHLSGAVVSAQLFSLLGVKPELGRAFLPGEDLPGATRGYDPVVLSYGLWKREFSADSSILGRNVQLGSQLFTVVGVMPSSFQFPVQAEPVELWTTMAVDAEGADAMTNQRGAHYLDVLGLLKPGVDRRRAQAELAAIAATLNKEHPENKPRTVHVVPEIEGIVGPVRTPLLVLLGAVGCVLLTVCVNVANLLLARASRRQREMAVRAALGASRWRVTCQLMTESLTLSFLGGISGVALAVSLLRMLVRIMPAQIPRLQAVGLNGRVLCFGLVVSLAAGVLFGVAPALQVAKVSVVKALNERAPGSGGTSGVTGLRGALVVSETALALVLLLGASLFIQSFVHLTKVDPGFNPRGVLTFQLDAPGGAHALAPEVFFRNVLAQVRVLPGIKSASAAASLPLTGDNLSTSVEIEGQPTPLGSRPAADFNAVEPNYFRTLGISLLAGRDFTPYDDAKSTPVVVINRTLARRFFGGQNPIGKRIRPGIGNGYGSGEPPMREIVGVISDVKQSGLGNEAAPEVYAPLAQSPFPTMYVVLNTGNDPGLTVAGARRQIALLDKNSPVYHVENLEHYFAGSVMLPRLIASLLSGFAGLALLLTCLGVYGVISYIVVQRTHEIGIRMALGSRKSDVLRMIVSEGLRPALIGIAIGVFVTLKLTRVLASLLYGVKPADPLTFVAVSAALTGMVLLACYIPARRATNVDPMLSLRHE